MIRLSQASGPFQVRLSSSLTAPRPDTLGVERNHLAIKRLTIFRVCIPITLKMVNYLYHNALRATMICHGLSIS